MHYHFFRGITTETNFDLILSFDDACFQIIIFPIRGVTAVMDIKAITKNKMFCLGICCKPKCHIYLFPKVCIFLGLLNSFLYDIMVVWNGNVIKQHCLFLFVHKYNVWSISSYLLVSLYTNYYLLTGCKGSTMKY